MEVPGRHKSMLITTPTNTWFVLWWQSLPQLILAYHSRMHEERTMLTKPGQLSWEETIPVQHKHYLEFLLKKECITCLEEVSLLRWTSGFSGQLIWRSIRSIRINTSSFGSIKTSITIFAKRLTWQFHLVSHQQSHIPHITREIGRAHVWTPVTL